MSRDTIKVLDLFAGAGGLSLGFDLVKDKTGKKVFEIIKAVELDEEACETLRIYFQREYGRQDIVIQGDLTKPKIHKEIIEACKGKVSVIVGGPPCQSFSMLGPRSGYGVKDKKYEKYKNDERDKLYKEYLKIVKELKPAFIIFENVKGIISKRGTWGKRYIDIIAADFKKLGYTFKSEDAGVKEDYLLLNAADYGVPQIRERVFLIGNRVGKTNPFPNPTHRKPEGKTTSKKLASWMTLNAAIGDLPELRAKFTLTDIPKRLHEEIKTINSKRFSGFEVIPFDVSRYKQHFNSLNSSERSLLEFVRAGANGTMAYHEARPQQKDDIALFAGMPQGWTAEKLFESKSEKAKKLRKLIKYRMKSASGEYAFGDKYRKQSWNNSSTTLFAHLAKDGNRFIHPDGRQARTFTVREAARIQTFPDWYDFFGSRSSKFRQIGNAVPPLLATKIAESIFRVVITRKEK